MVSIKPNQRASEVWLCEEVCGYKKITFDRYIKRTLIIKQWLFKREYHKEDTKSEGQGVELFSKFQWRVTVTSKDRAYDISLGWVT